MSGPKRVTRDLAGDFSGRLTALRIDKGLTQAEFAAGIGSTRGTYAKYESGANGVTAAVMDSICKTYGVRREWLETGEGDMYISQTVDEELAGFFAEIMDGVAPEFQRNLAAEMARMPPALWDALIEFAKILARSAGIEKKEEEQV